MEGSTLFLPLTLLGEPLAEDHSLGSPYEDKEETIVRSVLKDKPIVGILRSLGPLALGQRQLPILSPQIQGGPGRSENSPSIYDFIHSQEEPLHVLQQSSLFYIFPESPKKRKTSLCVRGT